MIMGGDLHSLMKYVNRKPQEEVNGDQLKTTSHYPHLAKMQGMKDISKPQLLGEVYTI
jgi:hypothetical protein